MKKDVVFSGLFASVLLFCVLPVFGQNFTIGSNFTGTSHSQSGFIPPDTMGAAGPNHVVELVNGRFAVYDKSGSLQTSSSLNTFWGNSGAGHDGSYAFDPRILYDSYSGRWFASSVDNAGGANNFLVAVSNTSNPTAGWSGFKIDADSDNQQWADFPTMGINADGLYVSANMFGISGGGFTVNTLVVPKSDLLSATPNVAHATLLENVSATTGSSAQPVFDMDNSSMPADLWSGSSSYMKRSQINGPVSSPSIASAGVATVSNHYSPPDADQPGTKKNLNTGDYRLSSNVIKENGHFWGVQDVEDNGKAAVRWFEIDAATNTLLQEGMISDPDLAFYYPSIAVNDSDDVVIGFSGSGESQYVSTYAVVGGTDSASNTTTFSPVTLLKAGVSDYERLDHNNRNRWGDYSSTVLDPSDPEHFWTFQEFVSGSNEWSVQVTEIVVPEPISLILLIIGGLFLRKNRQ